jgi:hypothetical protein
MLNRLSVSLFVFLTCCFGPFAYAAQVGSATWLNDFRVQEHNIDKDLQEIQVAWLKQGEISRRKETREKFVLIHARLKNLDQKIADMKIQKKKPVANEEWLNVLQQASSLQNFNKIKFNDLAKRMNIKMEHLY